MLIRVRNGRDVSGGHRSGRETGRQPLGAGGHARGDDRSVDRAAAPEVVVVADRADRTAAAVEDLQVEDADPALARRHHQVRVLGARAIVRSERVLDHVLVEVGVPNREDDGLYFVRLAVHLPTLPVEAERVRTGRVADPDVRVEGERVEAGDQDLLYSGTEPAAGDPAGRVLEAADQLGALRSTEVEAGLPLAQGKRHRDAGPVQAAVIGGGESGCRLRVLSTVGGSTPEHLALDAYQRAGRGPVRDRAEQVAEERDLAIEPGAGQDLGRYGRAAGDAVVEALLLDRAGDGLVGAALRGQGRGGGRGSGGGGGEGGGQHQGAGQNGRRGTRLGRSLIRAVYQIRARCWLDPNTIVYRRQYARDYLLKWRRPQRHLS